VRDSGVTTGAETSAPAVFVPADATAHSGAAGACAQTPHPRQSPSSKTAIDLNMQT